MPKQLVYDITLFRLTVSGRKKIKKKKKAYFTLTIVHPSLSATSHKIKEESMFILAQQRIEFFITKLEKVLKNQKTKTDYEYT